MSKIKEMYDTIDNWYQTQDSKKIKYLCGERLYDDGKPEVRLQITVDWYLKIKGLDDEGKSLVFGEKLATLKDISQHMLNYLPTDEVLKEEERLAKKELGKDGFEEEYGYGMYDSCGHSSFYGTREIIKFWKNLSDRKILAVAGNSTQDEYEVDVHGGRSYYMRAKNIHEMIFNYVFYTLKLGSKEFDDNIFNSGESPEEIAFYYSGKCYAEKGLDPYLPSIEDVDKMYVKLVKRNNEKDVSNFNYMLDNIINQFRRKEHFADKVEILKNLKIT